MHENCMILYIQTTTTSGARCGTLLMALRTGLDASVNAAAHMHCLLCEPSHSARPSGPSLIICHRRRRQLAMLLVVAVVRVIIIVIVGSPCRHCCWDGHATMVLCSVVMDVPPSRSSLDIVIGHIVVIITIRHCCHHRGCQCCCWGGCRGHRYCHQSGRCISSSPSVVCDCWSWACAMYLERTWTSNTAAMLWYLQGWQCGSHPPSPWWWSYRGTWTLDRVHQRQRPCSLAKCNRKWIHVDDAKLQKKRISEMKMHLGGGKGDLHHILFGGF